MPVGPSAISPDALRALTALLVDELPELAPARVHAAVARAAGRAQALLDAPAPERDWAAIVDAQLERIAAAEGPARAALLRELADDFEHELGDHDRALEARLDAFAEVPATIDLDPLLRLAAATDRWRDLPLDAMTACAVTGDDDGLRARWLAGLADAWERRGDSYRAADCHEWVLSLAPTDDRAHAALERFYRDTAEWPALVALLQRRVERVEGRARAALWRELGALHDRELDDPAAALDAYHHADRLERDRPEVLDAIARLCVRLEAHDDAMAALARLIAATEPPAARARVLLRAAEVAWRGLDDGDTAHGLLARALRDDPDCSAAVDAMVALRRERGELAGAVELLLAAAARPALAAERARRLGDAAELCAELGEPARAAELYRAVRATDGGDLRAAAALADLYWETRSFDELIPILEELCVATHAPDRLRGYLLRLGEAAMARGDADLARSALTRAFALDGDDPAPRRALAELLFARGAWAEARAHIADLLERDEPDLARPVCVELHHRAAHCAHALGDLDDARRHAGIALALDPSHRATLLLQLELDAGDPAAQAADHLALATGAEPDEKAARYAAAGDLYAGPLADPAAARELYREALAYRPGDHLLLTKSLGLVAGDGDWSYSLDLLQRLIDTEQDPVVRARYRHVAAMILRDELGRRDDAAAALAAALDDAPTLFAAAADLEALLDETAEPVERIVYYYRRLEQLRHEACPPGELLRLWDRLGELCLAVGRREDALCAFEVALTFAPDAADRRQRLADLYLEAGDDHVDDAIAQHHEILARNRRRTASYEVLAALYARSGRRPQSQACEEALAVIGMRAVDSGRFRVARPLTGGAPTPLDADAWRVLAGEMVDVQLSALFALVTPAVAAARVRRRQPPRRPADAALADDDRPIARALRRALGVLGMPRPPAFVDRDQAVPCRIVLRPGDGVLAPALVIGPAALDGSLDERALAFTVARRLADLHPERFARLLCPRADELTQLVELAIVLGAGGDTDAASARGRAAQWLAASLHPVALDQVVALGRKLRARSIDPARAALDWLEATDRAADRLGLVVAGDLATCVRALELEPATRSDQQDRILELVWSSVTDDLLAVRARVEGWSLAAGLPTVDAVEAIPPHASRA
ncbi:MAG TPA: tetratricopeptide repeat protein [Kofleriaceae bacterium]|nr:tetratricopeptide repeat protein [Kofleriaceae bacterium]